MKITAFAIDSNTHKITELFVSSYNHLLEERYILVALVKAIIRWKRCLDPLHHTRRQRYPVVLRQKVKYPPHKLPVRTIPVFPETINIIIITSLQYNHCQYWQFWLAYEEIIMQCLHHTIHSYGVRAEVR